LDHSASPRSVSRRSCARYLIRDRDGVHGDQFRARLREMGIREVFTAPQSPWQDAFAERLIGSIRRECLDHVIALGEKHLRGILRRYFEILPVANSFVAEQGRSIDRRRATAELGAVVEIHKLAACIIATNVVLHNGETRLSAGFRPAPVTRLFLTPTIEGQCLASLTHSESEIGSQRADQTVGFPKPARERIGFITSFWRGTGHTTVGIVDRNQVEAKHQKRWLLNKRSGRYVGCLCGFAATTQTVAQVAFLAPALVAGSGRCT
jgi:hypothetical protein